MNPRGVLRLAHIGVLVGLLAAGPCMHAAESELTETVVAAEPESMEALVGPVALYPDDLLSIVLPASTFPLQIVEADRWLTENKGNADAKPKETWDDSVKALLNYPDVVSMMSDDLEWTAAMGEAVASDQTAVMDGVQSFRRKAKGAGNLQSDDKQTIVVEEEVVKIVQADPQVIYVPQYEPQTIIIQQPAPVYPTYYPTPYPCYYYPYPPGYAFASGFFWGASVAFAFNWWGGSIHNDIDIDIDRDVNRNVDRDRNVDRSNASERATNIDRGRSQEMARSKDSGWQPSQRPSDVRAGRTSAGTSSRAQVSGRTPSAAQSGARPSTGATGQRAQSARDTSATQRTQSTRASGATGSSTRYSNASRSASSARSSPPSRDAFSGMSGSRSASAHSARGSTSRGSFGGGGGRRR